MSTRSRRTIALTVILTAALFLTSCGASTTVSAPTAPPVEATAVFSAEPAEAATAEAETDYPPLRLLTSFAIADMNPIARGSSFTNYAVAEMLMKWDRDFTVKPWLLESLERIDDLNWRLTLRPNITFQNGKRLDAEALAALMRHRLAEAPYPQADLPGATVEVTGDLELVMTTSVPTAELPNMLAYGSNFPVYDVEAVEAVGEDYDKLVGAGIFTGPYQVVSLDDKEMVAERYEGYWGGMPPLPSITIGFVPDAQARILAVQNGEADIALYPPVDTKMLLEGRDDVYFVNSPRAQENVRLLFNLDEAPFDDSLVRRAFGFGIDYETLANDVLNGVYQASHGFYPDAFTFAVQNLKYDPEVANQLLDEAGWEIGADGIRVKDGQPLHVVFLIYPQQPDLDPMSVAIQAELREIGFDLEILSVDDINNVMKEDRVEWNAGLIFSGAISSGGTQQLRRYIHSQGAYNHGGINDPQLDALIEELDVTFDEAVRTELLHEIQDIIIVQQGYQFFVACKPFPAVVSPAYRDYVPATNFLHITFETKPTNP